MILDTRRPAGPSRGAIAITRRRIAEPAADFLLAEGYTLGYIDPLSTPAQIARAVAEIGPQAIMVSQGRITAEVIAATPALRVLVKHGSGVDNIDLAAAEARCIPVFRTVAANARPVAEHALAMVTALCKQLPGLDGKVKRGDWPKAEFLGRDYADTLLGLIGFGAIARELAALAEALSMPVAVHDPFAAPVRGVRFVADLDDLMAEADIVSVHCPLTVGTRHLIDARRLALMQPHAGLVNTARGGVVDEAALLEALRQGRIAGAAIDSFSTEPPGRAHPLLSAPNLIVSPHVAGVTRRAEERMAMGAARHIVDHLAGRTIDSSSLVGPDALSA
ncbi:NAD(P)-dependent oxidoreductase [Salipiger sp.]|uniref:NAD(P)-dependent oxidoreductase n=1 Tax=Salipiger sp. TaxID=2078585 RepID=UPI003A9739AA